MDWRTSLLKGLGYKPTKQNLAFLSTWQRWEGGHTNNDARFNWLNTTKPARGALGTINSVGVQRFDSYENGIAATIATLRNGRYGDVLEALESGDPYSRRPVAGLQTWVSGSPTGNPGYAQKVLGGKVVGSPKGPTKNPRLRPPRVESELVQPKSPNGAWDYAMSLIFADDPRMK